MNHFTVNVRHPISTIRPEIYSNFSEHLGRCIYNGVYVGENSSIPNANGMRTDVVEALKKIKLAVLRWPGGCFADEYHWKDGIGDKALRKKMINTNWGGVTEDNSFGTHEFMELCRQIGCEPYINGNVGSGTVQEMSEWVEYLTFDGVSPMADLRAKNGHPEAWKVKYFGVGNESWGCGGNMTPEYYANEYRRYQTFVKNYPGNKIYRIACGPNVDDYNWTETMMKNAGRMMDGISLHYYTVPGDWGHKGSATVFDKEEYYKTLSKTMYMDELIEKHGAIIKKYTRNRHHVGLIVDEWGTWYDVEPGTNPGFLYQQNTMRDAIVAGLNLNIFNKHSDIVDMANIAQLINVLQSLILTDGADMILTPTYHVFDLYQVHQGAELVESFIQSKQIGTEEFKLPELQMSASVNGANELNLTIVNTDADEAKELCGTIEGIAFSSFSAEILTDKIDAHNTFDAPETVKTAEFKNIAINGEKVTLTVPPCSVLRVTLK